MRIAVSYGKQEAQQEWGAEQDNDIAALLHGLPTLNHLAASRQRLTPCPRLSTF